MKKFLIAFLSLMLLLCTAFAFACGGDDSDDKEDSKNNNATNNLQYSQGLEYSLNSDGNSCSIIGMGSCMDTDIVIPLEYNGKPVTCIGKEAFFSAPITNITIPSSITSIENYAFFECTALSSITIPNSVTSIEHAAFVNCTSLASVELGKSVILDDDTVFNGCSSLVSISVDENNANYKSIEGNLYSKDGNTLIKYAIGKTATEFVIPDSVTSIGGNSFGGCTSLTSIEIPNSVMSIGDGAFNYCTSLTSIAFNGTVAEWYAVEKNWGWDIDFPATKVICTDGEVQI